MPQLLQYGADVFGSLVKLIYGIVNDSSELDNSSNTSKNALSMYTE